jgi:hypothetical protein
MVYACAGRLADARRLALELDERQGRGEYIVPAARLAIPLGTGDKNSVRDALARCTDGGAAPFTVISMRPILDRYRADASIDELLDSLHDGARP